MFVANRTRRERHHFFSTPTHPRRERHLRLLCTYWDQARRGQPFSSHGGGRSRGCSHLDAPHAWAAGARASHGDAADEAASQTGAAGAAAPHDASAGAAAPQTGAAGAAALRAGGASHQAAEDQEAARCS